ncbi:MAG: hypothetical protein ACRECX_08375 [Methyloceanibacter sp.]|uniref:hypothetical protein n=1 Tax=Methyloceanibacter sp. TaxID=1965321 RepID=UPI003D6C8891
MLAIVLWPTSREPRSAASKRRFVSLSSYVSVERLAMPEHRDREEIEPELYQGIGHVVVAWATIEALMAEFLSHLIPADPGGMYVLNQNLSSDTKIKCLRVLCEMRFTDPNTTLRLGDLLQRIDDARQERNGYVHGMWSTQCEPGAVLIQTINLNRAEIVRHELTTRADFDDLIARLKDITQELLYLGRTLGFLTREDRGLGPAT